MACVADGRTEKGSSAPSPRDAVERMLTFFFLDARRRVQQGLALRESFPYPALTLLLSFTIPFSTFSTTPTLGNMLTGGAFGVFFTFAGGAGCVTMLSRPSPPPSPPPLHPPQ